MSKACLFCGAGGPGALSKEHVIPLWLLEFLGLADDDEMFHGVAQSATGLLAEPPRIHSSFTFVDGRVCEKDCNNGWMERLENAARPILVPLMQDRGVETLSVGEVAVLGKWAAKTAYLHTWAGMGGRPVQLEHLRALKGDDGVPVQGVTLFAMKATHKKPTAYVGGGAWPQLGTPQMEPDGQPPRNAYKIGLQFGCLHLLVAFWPDPASLLLPATGVHVQVSPPASPEAESKWNPPPSLLRFGDGSVDKLVAFVNCLAVLHPS
jgi:hypothetical protein